MVTIYYMSHFLGAHKHQIGGLEIIEHPHLYLASSQCFVEWLPVFEGVDEVHELEDMRHFESRWQSQ